MNVDTSHIPLKRPHFRLQENKLFFLISKRPYLELDLEELAIWNAIDGVKTVAALREGCIQSDKHIRKFIERELMETTASQWEKDRKRVLVIEPHMDDAILSVGGLMWQNRGICEFTVASVAGRSNFTSYHKIDRDYFDVDVVTALRRAESELVMRVLGGKHLVLDGLDAPLRYQPGNWTLEWFRNNRRGISAFINHSASDAEVDECTVRIERLLVETDAAEVWIPLGVGTSADHETTRNACLIALLRLAREGRHFVVFLYQDVPYALNFPKHTAQILTALVTNGASIQRMPCDVTEHMPAKLRLISIFASQFKMSYMQPKVADTARLVDETGDRSSELLIKLEKLPTGIDPVELYSGRDDVLALRRRLVKWYPKNRTAQRITILCPMGCGRWKEDMEELLHYFAEADFDVHMTDDACDETMRLLSPRIRISPVHGLGKGWILRLLRVFIWQRHPLILFTGTKFRRAIPLIKIIFFHLDPLAATTMNHLVLALASGRKSLN